MLLFTGWVIIRGGGSWVFSMTELPSEGWVGLGLDPGRPWGGRVQGRILNQLPYAPPEIGLV